MRSKPIAGRKVGVPLAKLDTTRTAVHSDKLGEVAAEFEAVHNVERARQVGSVHQIIPAAELHEHRRGGERGMVRTLEERGH